MRVAKFLAAVLGALAMALQSASSDEVVTNPEWVQVALALATAISVYMAANLTNAGAWLYTKAAVAGVMVLFQAWLGYLANNDHLTTSMWMNVFIAAITAAVVFVAPAPVPADGLSTSG